jgi:hypothetical protein
MWEDNIKMDLEVKDEEAWTEFISLGTVALADTITNVRILYNVRTLNRRATTAVQRIAELHYVPHHNL